MDTRRIRILVVDDHSFVRLGLVEYLQLEPDFEVVGSARNGTEALALNRQHGPDVALVDLMLPDLDGIGLITALRLANPPLRALILSTYHGDEDIYRAFKAGAAGYVLKSAEPAELVAAIRAAQAGEASMSPPVAAALARRLSRPDLTARELDVLRLLTTGHSNKEIGAALGISEGTAKLHVHRLLDKLGVADRTQAALRALQSGLIRPA